MAIAVVNSIGNLGGFIGPYTIGVLRDATGSFQIGLIASAATMVAAAVLVCLAVPAERSSATAAPSHPASAADAPVTPDEQEAAP